MNKIKGKLVTERAEESFLEAVDVCRKVNVPLRCIHLRLTPLASHAAFDQARILQTISTALEDLEAMIYCCADGDVFILSRVATSKTLLRLLGSLPPDLVPAPDAGLAHLFEVNVEGLKLIALCQEKIRIRQKVDADKARQEQEKAQQDKATKERQLAKSVETDIALNAPLIATLPTRRAERKQPAILVVEDDLFSQRLVSNALRAHADVHLTDTGRDGLMGVLKYAPDMILLDINLPDMTGLEIISEIFAVDPRAHVVMLSGNGNRENVMKAIENGAKGFISKPFTLEKLMQAIDKCPLIQEKRNRRENIHA